MTADSQAGLIRAAEQADAKHRFLVAAIQKEMDCAYAQMADDLARYHWGDTPGPPPRPLTRMERLGYAFGWWWYSARMSMVRGFARLLRVDLPRDDD